MEVKDHKLTVFECTSPVLLSGHLLSSEGGEAIIQACLYQRSPTHIENMALKTFDTRCSYCDEMRSRTTTHV